MHDLCGNECSGMGQFDGRHAGGRVSTGRAQLYGKKYSLVLSRKDYHTQYEPIWYGWLEGHAFARLKTVNSRMFGRYPAPKSIGGAPYHEAGIACSKGNAQ